MKVDRELTRDEIESTDECGDERSAQTICIRSGKHDLWCIRNVDWKKNIEEDLFLGKNVYHF